MNGRIILDDKPGISYDLFEKSRVPHSFQNSLTGIQDSNLLNKTFFSQKNIDFIHKSIIIEVGKQTGYKISRQNDTELQIIMRSIYLQYGRNEMCNIKEQVQELNEKVINFAVFDKIIPGISQFLEYKNDINSLPIPLSHPQNLSNSGNKTLSTFRSI